MSTARQAALTARAGALVLGSRLGDYEIGELVPGAPLALVYRAHHLGQQRPVLVKVLAGVGDHSGPDTTSSELSRIATLRHPNILPVEHLGEVNGIPYVVTPAEPSASLADRLATGRLEREEAVALLGGIARALDHAHGAGVQHGGLGAAAVKLAADGAPVVADFGLARLADASMAEPAADTYAFAAIAYELLTGTAPIGEGDGSKPAPASTREPMLPVEVDEVFLRGLAQDPAERWPSCGAMLGALEPALRAAVPAVPATLPRPRARLPSRTPLAAAAGLVLVLGVLVAWLALHLATTPASPAAPSGEGLPAQVPGLLSNGALSPPSVAGSSGTPRQGAVAPTIRLGTETLRRGDALAVSGVGFDPRGQFLITLDQGGTQYQLLPPTAGPANGSFSVRVFIPGQATPGPATITACATTSSGRAEGCAQQRVSVAS